MTTIVRLQFGSHVYGTNVPTSDLDFKAVHLPGARDILLQRVRPAVSVSTKADGTQKNTAGDTDFESFALQKEVHGPSAGGADRRPDHAVHPRPLAARTYTTYGEYVERACIALLYLSGVVGFGAGLLLGKLL